MTLPDISPARGAEPGATVTAVSVPANDRLDLRALASTFQRRIWLFLSIVVLVLLVAGFLTFSQTPKYVATARVMLDTGQMDVAPTDERADQPSSTSDAAIDTEVELIRSRAIAGQVVSLLNLQADPQYNPALRSASADGNPVSRLKRGIKSTLSTITPRSTGATGAQPANDDIVDNLLAGLSSRRVGITYAIDLSYEGTNPAKAAKIANAFAEIYTRYKLDRKVNENQQATGLLGGRIESLRQQAQADSAAVQQYRIANNLLSTSGASLTEQEISAYNQQVTQARAQAAEDVARLNTAKAQLRSGSAGDDVGEALSSPVVQSLRGQRAAVSAKVADLQGRYGPRHPEMATAQRSLADIDAQIQAEINRVISNLEAKSRVSNQRLASLQGSLGGARQSLRQNNQAMVRLGELQLKATTSQSLYESYLERFRQTAAQEGTMRADARVISNARVPKSPSKPNVSINLMFGLLLGVGLGVAASFIAETVFSAVTTGDEVEQVLGQRYLGAIPLVTSVEKAGKSPIESPVDFPLSAFAESVRSIRTSLQYTAHTPPRTVVVTSALPQEGKTTTSICLARSAALQGRNVLLVDTDVRRRGVDRLLKATVFELGLIDVLRGDVPLEAALLKDGRTGLNVLPVGTSWKGSEEMVGGERMDEFLAAARTKFDLIIIDSAPVLPIAETRSLAAKVDAVIFVVRWRKTPVHAVRTALRLLPNPQTHLAGVVLTRLDMRRQARFGYGDAGYYYKQYKEYYG